MIGQNKITTKWAKTKHVFIQSAVQSIGFRKWSRLLAAFIRQLAVGKAHAPFGQSGQLVIERRWPEISSDIML